MDREGRRAAQEEQRGREEEHKGQQGGRGGVVVVERGKIRKSSMEFSTQGFFFKKKVNFYQSVQFGVSSFILEVLQALPNAKPNKFRNQSKLILLFVWVWFSIFTKLRLSQVNTTPNLEINQYKCKTWYVGLVFYMWFVVGSVPFDQSNGRKIVVCYCGLEHLTYLQLSFMSTPIAQVVFTLILCSLHVCIVLDLESSHTFGCASQPQLSPRSRPKRFPYFSIRSLFSSLSPTFPHHNIMHVASPCGDALAHLGITAFELASKGILATPTFLPFSSSPLLPSTLTATALLLSSSSSHHPPYLHLLSPPLLLSFLLPLFSLLSSSLPFCSFSVHNLYVCMQLSVIKHVDSYHQQNIMLIYQFSY